MGKIVNIMMVFGILFVAMSLIVGLVAAQDDHAEETTEEANPAGVGLKLIGAGLAVGLSGVGAGIGEASIGAAAVGAMAEDPKMFGKGLLMTVIPETIVIFGLLIAFMIIGS